MCWTRLGVIAAYYRPLQSKGGRERYDDDDDDDGHHNNWMRAKLDGAMGVLSGVFLDSIWRGREEQEYLGLREGGMRTDVKARANCAYQRAYAYNGGSHFGDGCVPAVCCYLCVHIFRLSLIKFYNTKKSPTTKQGGIAGPIFGLGARIGACWCVAPVFYYLLLLRSCELAIRRRQTWKYWKGIM